MYNAMHANFNEDVKEIERFDGVLIEKFTPLNFTVCDLPIQISLLTINQFNNVPSWVENNISQLYKSKYNYNQSEI